MSMARRFAAIGGLRRGSRVPGGVAAPTSLEGKILAELAAVSWHAHGIYLARYETITDVGSGETSVWADLSGHGSDVTQGTSADRPMWSDTAVSGGPGLSFSSDALIASAHDFSGYSSNAIFVVGGDNSGTSSSVAAAIGSVGAGDGMELRFDSSSDVVGCIYDTGAPRSRVSGTSDISVAAVHTATVDSALSTNETEVRRNGSNVTSSRPNNDDCGSLGSALKIGIGDRDGAGAALTAGYISAVVIAGGAGPISGSVLTAIANIETLLSDALSAGDYS